MGGEVKAIRTIVQLLLLLNITMAAVASTTNITIDGTDTLVDIENLTGWKSATKLYSWKCR